MTRLSAVRSRTALTMSPDPHAQVLENACIVHACGVIIDAGDWRAMRKSHSFSAADVDDMGEVVLTPGLINAHTHLELSHLRGRLVRSQGFPAWVRSLLASDADTLDLKAMADAIAEMHATGTTHVVAITGRNLGPTAHYLKRLR